MLRSRVGRENSFRGLRRIEWLILLRSCIVGQYDISAIVMWVEAAMLEFNRINFRSKCPLSILEAQTFDSVLKEQYQAHGVFHVKITIESAEMSL